MGLLLEVKGAKINFNVTEFGIIRGYKFAYSVPDSKYAKGHEDSRELVIKGSIPRTLTQAPEVIEQVRKWAKVEYEDRDTYYNWAKLTHIYRDETIRYILFPDAFVKNFIEEIDPHTGDGIYTLILMQKLDKRIDIEVGPFNEVHPSLSDIMEEAKQKQEAERFTNVPLLGSGLGAGINTVAMVGSATNATPLASTTQPNYTLSITNMSFDDGQFIPIRRNRNNTVNSSWSVGGFGFWNNDTPEPIVVAFVHTGSNHNFRVNATFRFSNNNGNNVPVRVIAGSLGTSNQVNVSRVSGWGTPNNTNQATFTLRSNSADVSGFRRITIPFQWQFRNNVGTWVNMRTIDTTVYFIPARPTLPWIIDTNGNRSNPWADALDMLLGWGVEGMSSIVDISTQINLHINRNINFVYEIERGATSWLAINGNFRCTDFITNVNSGREIIGNCTDCATVISTFANLLGANLNQIIFIRNDGSSFWCNRIKVIGFRDMWQFPFPLRANGTRAAINDTTAVRGGFGYHEIASTGTGSISDSIYDPCLEVNENVFSSNRSALLPANQRFATRDTFDRQLRLGDNVEYKEMLLLNETVNLNRTVIIPELTGRRAIE